MISKPYEGGQFINLSSSGRVAWSIGTIYNESAFAISDAQTRDNLFKNPFFSIARNGNIGIGTINTTSYKLDVKGTIRATEIRVETTGADFVFENDYELPSLDEVAAHIQEKSIFRELRAQKKCRKTE